MVYFAWRNLRQDNQLSRCSQCNNLDELEEDELYLDGCNINKCDKFKIRPIILAAKRDHVKGVNLCLKCGALEEVCDDQGRSAFFYACMNGNEEIFNLLYDSKRIDMELRQIFSSFGD